MVDVNTQNKTISVNVSSSGVSSNVNASGDTTMYYSNKAREWAISNRIVDSVDYSSKYYANISKTNALQSAETRELLQSEYNEYSQSLLDIATTEGNNAISAIQSQQTTSVNAVKTEGTTQVNLAKAQAIAAANSATQASNVVKEVEEDLASKVDIDDMVEVDFADAGSYIAGCAMPSDKYVELTLGATLSTYTAPANGWFAIYMSNAAEQTAGHYVHLHNTTAGDLGNSACSSDNSWQPLSASVPAKKGDVIQVTYLAATQAFFRFVYAQGSESEVQ